MTPLVLVLILGATWRATLLVVDDELTEPPREWVKARVSGHAVEHVSGKAWGCICGKTWTDYYVDDGQAAIHAENHVHAARAATGGVRGKLLTLIACPWCVSMWLGAAVSATAWAWGSQSWWQFGAAALTASGWTGLAHKWAHP